MNKEMLNYFKGEKEFFEFCLINLSGNVRMDLLEITSIHFSNKKESKKWYDNIKVKITNEYAIYRLEELYNQMA